MHTHSRNSHDSECLVSDMLEAAKQNGLCGFAVTDHCDIGYYKDICLSDIISGSLADAKTADKTDGITVLRGIEIGEAFWHPEIAENIINNFDFDVIIGSVHAVKFSGLEMPYSQINFAEIGKEKTAEYLGKYFDDMLMMAETCTFDVLAHLTCPLRYINGKYNLGLSLEKYGDKIKNILDFIIGHKIALEINTSCVYNNSRYCEFMPEKEIIKAYKNMGGHLITTGSDAHIARNSANSFDALYALLKEVGFKNAYYYKNRTATPYEI